MGQNYGYSGEMNHFLAAWLPNFAMLFAGLVLFFIMYLPYIKTKSPVSKGGKK
jgi:hypothetical protein